MPPDALPVSREEIDRHIAEKGVTKVARGVSGLVDENGNWIGGDTLWRKKRGGKKKPPSSSRGSTVRAEAEKPIVPAKRANVERFAKVIEPKAPEPKTDPPKRKAAPAVDNCACGRWKSKSARRCNHCASSDFEKQARYRALVAEGKTANEIAEAMGVKRKSVYQMLKRLDLKAKPQKPGKPHKTGPTAATRAYANEIRKMADAGWRTSAIAEALSISTSRVYQIANAFGIETTRAGLGQKPHQETRDRYREAHARGLTSSEIADVIGVTKRAVRAMLAKLDLTPHERAEEPRCEAPAAPMPQIDVEAVRAALTVLERAPTRVYRSGAVIRATGLLRQALKGAP